MMLIIRAKWEINKDDVTGNVTVTNAENKELMNETRTYSSFDKFLDYVDRNFYKNPRFTWEKAICYRPDNCLKIIAEDRGRKT